MEEQSQLVYAWVSLVNASWEIQAHHPSPSLSRSRQNLSRSLISLVDEDRQWFKSKVGMELPQTPRHVSFCTHALREEEPLVINDALNDPRFSDNPLVTSEPYKRHDSGMTMDAPTAAGASMPAATAAAAPTLKPGRRSHLPIRGRSNCSSKGRPSPAAHYRRSTGSHLGALAMHAQNRQEEGLDIDIASSIRTRTHTKACYLFARHRSKLWFTPIRPPIYAQGGAKVMTSAIPDKPPTSL